MTIECRHLKWPMMLVRHPEKTPAGEFFVKANPVSIFFTSDDSVYICRS